MDKDYKFYDSITGELFLVETDSKEDAIATAKAIFEDPKLIDVLTVTEGEWEGLDTY